MSSVHLAVRVSTSEVLLCESSQTGSSPQRFLLAFLVLAQDKVKVRRRGHGIEDVGFVWYEQLSFLGDDLSQGEVLPVHVLKVMLLQRPLDHVSSFVLTGQQDAFVHVAVVVSEVHAHPDDAGVGHLTVIDGEGRHGYGAFVLGGQRRLRMRAATGRRSRAQVGNAVGG